MDQPYRDIRKIDPTRGSTLGDGSPNDNDRIEIGPSQLAFDEWAVDGLALPDLDAMRRYRWDRLTRHIVDRDIAELREQIATKLNFEMGNTPEIVEIALATKPDFVCLVPEHRAEVTTEGGLDVAGNRDSLKPTIDRLQQAGIEVSLFIDPVEEHIAASAELGVEMVELHTGAYANVEGEAREAEAGRLAEGARQAHAAGIQVNAGHGITTSNLPGLFGVPHMVELNIGHHLISRSISIGLGAAVEEMLAVMANYGS